MSETIELIPDTIRQASRTFRGYAYQAYQTILSWLNCQPGEELLTEFAEDLDLIRRDLDENVTDAELNQIKHKKGTVTLNNKAAIDLINNFFEHRRRNPQINISIRLCTISDRGREKRSHWVYAEFGMDLWDILKKRKLGEGDQKKAIHILRSFLLQNKDLSDEAKKFLRESNDSNFLNSFIDRIFWDTGQQSYGEIENEIREILAKRPRPIVDPMEVQQVIDRLWRYVTNVIAGEPGRILTRQDVEELLAQETSVVVDRRIVKETSSDIAEIKQSTRLIEGGIGTLLERLAPASTDPGKRIEFIRPVTAFLQNVPPLPTICSARSEVIGNIEQACKSHLVTWVHGSTGYGKTILLNLFIRKQGNPFLWFGLRDLIDFNLISSLQLILSMLQNSKEKELVIVMDDLRILNQNTYCIELLHAISSILAQRNSKLMVTSQFEPPVRFKSNLDKDIYIFDAPEMSVEEISLLLKELGLIDDSINNFWSTYILASTSGHPQLVSAYVTYLRDIDWKLSSLDEFFKKPRAVEEIKVESRKLLAESISSSDARELARRLSVLVGTFDREFALNVAFARPSLKEPGRAFDALVGPWIEAVGNDLYALSPLLGGYAEAEFGRSGLTKYYTILSEAWLKKKSLTAIDVIQAITAGLISRVEPLILKVCGALLVGHPEKLQLIAKDLSILSCFDINAGGEVGKLDPRIRYMFRYLQLKICEYNGDWSTYMRIDDLVLKEIDEMKSEPLYDEIYFSHHVYTSIRIDSPTKPKERINRALNALQRYDEVSSIRGEINSNQVRPGDIVVIASHSISTLDELEFFLDKLEQQSPEILSMVFSGFDAFVDSIQLLIDRVWLSESKQQTPQWLRCEELFLRVMNFGKNHNIEWLLAAAARGRMVVSDEYLNDPDKAMQVAAEARSMIAKSHPLIDLAESMVLFRHEDYRRALKIVMDVEKLLPANVLTLTRVFAMDRGIQSAARIGAWEKAIECAIQGQKLSDKIDDRLLGEVMRIAFTVELGWAAHESGDFPRAAKHFKQALNDMELFRDQEYPHFKDLYMKFGHAMAWASHIWMEEPAISEKNQETALAKPSSGRFGNIEDLPEELRVRSAAPYPLSWSMIAMYAARVGQRDIVEFCTRRAMRMKDEAQYYLAVLKAWEALFVIQLHDKDFDAALRSGVQYVRLSVLGFEFRTLKNEVLETTEAINLESKFQELGSTGLNKWAEMVQSVVLEPLFMVLCSLEKPTEINFLSWSKYMEDTFGPENEIITIPPLFEIGMLAVFGDEMAIEKTKEHTRDISKLPENFRRFSFLVDSASRVLPVNDILSAQSSILLGVAVHLRGTIWAAAFCKMVATRWIFLAEKQRFLLSTPSLSVREILKLALLPYLRLSDCANLLLVVAKAINTKWSKEVFEALRKLGNPNLSKDGKTQLGGDPA